jgi:hypothetical protein
MGGKNENMESLGEDRFDLVLSREVVSNIVAWYE